MSYHHAADSDAYAAFARVFSEGLEVVQDNSVERQIGSDDADYVIRRIRENYLTGSSVTIVLCGRNTYGRKFVDWEILASLNQEMGLVGLCLPTNPQEPNGTYRVPDRLYDNWKSGYAVWSSWNTVMTDHSALSRLLEDALSRPKRLSVNSRPRLLRNQPLQ